MKIYGDWIELCLSQMTTTKSNNKNNKSNSTNATIKNKQSAKKSGNNDKLRNLLLIIITGLLQKIQRTGKSSKLIVPNEKCDGFFLPSDNLLSTLKMHWHFFSALKWNNLRRFSVILVLISFFVCMSLADRFKRLMCVNCVLLHAFYYTRGVFFFSFCFVLISLCT